MMQANHSSSTQANSKADYNMPHESYAESLRVIGQALETLRISAFALTKDDDKFIVRNWEPSFLMNIANEVWAGLAIPIKRLLREQSPGIFWSMTVPILSAWKLSVGQGAGHRRLRRVVGSLQGCE